jgi:hypothetical protein
VFFRQRSSADTNVPHGTQGNGFVSYYCVVVALTSSLINEQYVTVAFLLCCVSLFQKRYSTDEHGLKYQDPMPGNGVHC